MPEEERRRWGGGGGALRKDGCFCESSSFTERLLPGGAELLLDKTEWQKTGTTRSESCNRDNRVGLGRLRLARCWCAPSTGSILWSLGRGGVVAQQHPRRFINPGYPADVTRLWYFI